MLSLKSFVVSVAMVGCAAFLVACPGEEAPPVAEVSCISYCDDMQRLCTGDDAQYPDNATCQKFCATFKLKEAGNPGANTIESTRLPSALPLRDTSAKRVRVSSAAVR